MKQLELFPTEMSSEEEFEKMKEEWSRVRKALFQQNAELKKMYQELSHEFMLMKLHICKGKVVL